MSSIRLRRSRAVSTRAQRLCSAALALPLAIALCVAPAAAQTSDAVHHADAITVTGVRQAYRGDFALREIPQSIAEIDAETMQQNNILRLTDALDMNASVARQNTLGGLWDSFAIRGFAGDENLPSGYLVNGFNAGRGFGGQRDVAGIERVEVLKGPAAALIGRGEIDVGDGHVRAGLGETEGEGGPAAPARAGNEGLLARTVAQRMGHGTSPPGNG